LPVGAWPTDFYAFTGSRGLRLGTGNAGVAVVDARAGSITLAPGATEGTWTSPEQAPPAGFSELVASWQADTPPGSWIEIAMQARTPTTTSRWYEMGVWALDTSTVTRHSVDGQDDAVGKIASDTFVARHTDSAAAPVAYRLRATLHGTKTARPVLRQLAAATSLPGEVPVRPSPTTIDHTIDLAVPGYSQEVHRGEYPAYDGGGEAWCSPASTAMVMAYYGKGPSPDELAGLAPDRVFDAHGRADAVVDYAAIHTYDVVNHGAGNWPFNTAYASAYGLDGSVRQYSSLRALEDWIRRGVPLVVSLNWNNGDADLTNDLDGASIVATGGHLLVVRGFTATGDVIANDPASPDRAGVRRVYKRAQVEHNWLRASHGTTYVIEA